jgi:hypothetical protein
VPPFANVRLLPCYATATTQNVVSATRSAVSQVTRPRQRDGYLAPIIVDSLQKVGVGVDRILDRPQGRAADAATDSSLLVRIGVVLGFVYLALLTVWFWATSRRWTSRRTA